MMKRFFQLCLGLLLLLTACSSNTAAPADRTAATASASTTTPSTKGDRLLIGGLAPLTGDKAMYDAAPNNASKMAFDEINGAGGILNKRLEFLLTDANTEDLDAANDDKLSQAGISALLGEIAPTEEGAALPKEENLPMITLARTPLALAPSRANVFYLRFSDLLQGEMLAKFAFENLGAKTAAVMKNASSDYSNGVSQAFLKKAESLGMKIVAQETYKSDDKDFRAQLTAIAAENPDVLLIPDVCQVVARLVPEAREVGIAATFLGSDGFDGILQQLNPSSYSLVEGCYFANHYAVDDPNPKVQDFIQHYVALYHEEPTASAALGYDAAYILANAIKNAASSNPEAVIRAMKEINFDGVTGKLTFDQNNTPVKSVFIIQISDGRYKLDTVLAPD